MKKIVSLFTFLAFFSVLAISQTDKTANEAPAATQEENAAGPVMTFEKTEVDYGEIEQNSDPLRVFKFTNTGTEALVIQHAKGSCGCTVPSYPKEPIEPGKSGEIEVRYDTKRIGPFTKTVTLTTNEVEPKHVLKIKGKVNQKAPEPDGVPASNSGFGN